MTAFPCVSCGTLVDINPHEYDIRCKKCGEKRPFKCSKCGRRLGASGIYHPERLTNARKPIFCEECGSASDFVTCNQCSQTLMRSNCVERIINGKPHYYHQQCFDNALRLQNRIFPLAAVGFGLVIGYLGYMLGTKIGLAWVIGVVGLVIGVILARKVADLFAPK